MSLEKWANAQGATHLTRWRPLLSTRSAPESCLSASSAASSLALVAEAGRRGRGRYPAILLAGTGRQNHGGRQSGWYSRLHGRANSRTTRRFPRLSQGVRQLLDDGHLVLDADLHAGL